MPPKRVADASLDLPNTKKHKGLQQASTNSRKLSPNRRDKRTKSNFDLRSISTQNADAALKNGELDVNSFLKAREFEIKALEDGMRNNKRILKERAFQRLPRDMRRRTAAHNVKRVPKRLQNQAKREMILDNASTVNPSKRKPRSSRGRVRAETAKRLGILAAKKRAAKAKEDGKTKSGIDSRVPRPKLRTNKLNEPPRPRSKFRKRQIHKTWLPTHIWHAKRAIMTEAKKPLWRFAIPITSTEKSYRPTHRASGVRGAIVWDMSYMSTICLEGPAENLEKVLRAMGVEGTGQWEAKGEKWRSGKRSWSGWLSKKIKDNCMQIGPSTIIWCPPAQDTEGDVNPAVSKKKPTRKLFIRIHPSTFLETWTELLRLSKLQRPNLHVIDLRFEIGSIEITGPGSTEAILGILHPYPDCGSAHGETFRSLAGVTNPGSLPANAILSFPIVDPRLKYPPRPVLSQASMNEEAKFALLELLSTWPLDSSSGSVALFDRDSRFKATRLPSQKSINRRKSLAPPGAYPSMAEKDPQIPVILCTSRPAIAASAQGTWTILAPWKSILPIWYGLVHYPLSSGGNPRFGGLQELRQVHFEHGTPWFPADHPGTCAGNDWENDEGQKRKAKWDRRPKGKRVEWETLDLGAKRKGEIGLGWACDFERILNVPDKESSGNTTQDIETTATIPITSHGVTFQHLPRNSFLPLLSSTDVKLPSPFTLATIRINLVTRGVATPCARIYRLPAPSEPQEPTGSIPATTRQQWLALLPATVKGKPLPNSKSESAKASSRVPLNTPLPQRVRLLAQSLLQPPIPTPDGDDYPLVPDEEDLIGFVTTGEFNLAEGKGVAVGSVSVLKVVEGLRTDGRKGAKNGRLCIVRNAGEKIGRLARWEPV